MNSILKGDIVQMGLSAKEYLDKGVILYEKVLSIPLTARIPNLTHVYGLEAVHKLLAAMLTRFNNDLNLIRPMSADQILSCSLELVMTTEEDLLSMEDYLLFFKGAMEGKYGRILDRLDQQTVFTLLEEYREVRWKEYKRIEESRHLEYKALGPSERTTQRDELAEHFNSLVGRMGELKEKLKYEKEKSRANRL